uniref:Abscisic acid receptor PYL 6 n=1 Tax=Striga hermonthica TaxID=68872 RepID=A0A451FE05_STRHE|nr:abscisic acid receptor PYL 6 [Striga hermonthica]
MYSVYHQHSPNPNQCTSTVVQKVNAPLPLVWSMIRRFDRPQAYKQFIRNCTMLAGTGGVGSVREVALVTGIPGTMSRERLDKLDDDAHVMVYTTIHGDQRLDNYRSTTTAHETEGGRGGTTVVESYVVDVPEGNTKEDTCYFANTMIGFNLKSLASVSEMSANRG